MPPPNKSAKTGTAAATGATAAAVTGETPAAATGAHTAAATGETPAAATGAHSADGPMHDLLTQTLLLGAIDRAAVHTARAAEYNEVIWETVAEEFHLMGYAAAMAAAATGATAAAAATGETAAVTGETDAAAATGETAAATGAAGSVVMAKRMPKHRPMVMAKRMPNHRPVVLPKRMPLHRPMPKRTTIRVRDSTSEGQDFDRMEKTYKHVEYDIFGLRFQA